MKKKYLVVAGKILCRPNNLSQLKFFRKNFILFFRPVESAIHFIQNSSWTNSTML